MLAKRVPILSFALRSTWAGFRPLLLSACQDQPVQERTRGPWEHGISCPRRDSISGAVPTAPPALTAAILLGWHRSCPGSTCEFICREEHQERARVRVPLPRAPPFPSLWLGLVILSGSFQRLLASLPLSAKDIIQDKQGCVFH